MTRVRFIFFAVLMSIQICALSADQKKQKISSEVAVTYEMKGRLGNHLIAYLHGKWISEKYGIPLLYKSFNYSEFFIFEQEERYHFSDWKTRYRNNIIPMKSEDDLYTLKKPTLLEIPYFRDDPFFREDLYRKKVVPFEINWKLPEFRELAKRLLQPRFPVKTLELPKDVLKVVAHVRTGGGKPGDIRVRLNFIHKFPPESFYIDAIKKMSELHNHVPMYVFIMTDDTNPPLIAQRFREALASLTNITIACREGEAGHSVNVMEDFFSIRQFDCLIRGDSTFSIMGAMLGEQKTTIIPKTAHVEGENIVVDEMEVI